MIRSALLALFLFPLGCTVTAVPVSTSTRLGTGDGGLVDLGGGGDGGDRGDGGGGGNVDLAWTDGGWPVDGGPAYDGGPIVDGGPRYDGGPVDAGHHADLSH